MNRLAGALAALLLAVVSTPLSAELRPTKPVSNRALESGELDRFPHDGRRLFLSSIVFDPAEESPDFREVGLQAGSEGDYAIVQFRPGQTARKEALERLGVRFFGYLPDNAFQARVPAEVRGRIEADPAVRWVGSYVAGYKVHPRLHPGSGDPNVGVTIRIFSDGRISKVAAVLQKRYPDARQTHLRETPGLELVRFAVPLSRRDEFVREAASIAEVSWIEPYLPLELHNINSSGPIQGGVAGAAGRTIFGHGITGSGEIVAVADTGLDPDMCFFRKLGDVQAVTEATNTVGADPGPVFANRKVLGYWVQPGADAYDTDAFCGEVSASFHGTHTAGTVLGDSDAHLSSRTDAGIDDGDGMAPNAQLIVQDLGSDDGCLGGDNDYEMYLQALRAGARVHSNSFGSDSAGAYSSGDETLDRFLFDHDEMTIVFSAGNSGPAAGSTGSPGNAKNVITVGALGNGDNISLAVFSSRGPTADGRIKPDIMAPGRNIVSAGGNTTFGDGNCLLATLSGTSMSAPTVAGGAALLRQYFEDGFYPTGIANAADAFSPRAPLVKAVLLNGTLPTLSLTAFGDTKQGWGRIFLDNNLFFPGDPRELRVWNPSNTEGLKTGQSHSYTVTVAAGQEFRATLVWSDPEATPGAASTLVNDLDLTVRNPNGTFVGNNLNAGETQPGGSADQKNTVEQVRFSAPAAGTYTITVNGRNVPGNGRARTDRQGYALAVSHATCSTGVTGAPTGLVATSNAQMGVDLTFNPASGSTVTQVYRASGTGAAAGEYQYVGTATGSTFTDTRAQGGETYSYKLRGADGCGEGPISTAVNITATGSCDIGPQFAGIASAQADSTNCRINLTWPAATANCKLGQTVVYNVYRSTSPDFTPGTPLATVAGTSYSDTNVSSGTTYHYIVRAEDGVTGSTGPHGGNEEKNTIRLFATAFGAPGATGTWRDDAGDTNAYLTPEGPWRLSAVEKQAGTRSYHSGPDGGVYPAETCASLVSPPLQLGAGAELSYWTRYNLEWQWDGVIVEISTDGGETWVDLPPTTPAGYPSTLAQTTNPPINACGYPSTHGAFTGPQDNDDLTAWTEQKTSLTAFAGRTVRIRWRLTTDPGLAFQGFYLDTIAVTNVNLPGACTPTAAAPVAAFSFSPQHPEEGEAVRFSDQSTNTPTSWQWSFGDGGTSTQQNPTHTYATAGTYTVTLVVFNSLGTSTKTATITVSEPGSGPKKRRAVRH